MSLNWRLFFSYILISLVTLIFSFVILIFVTQRLQNRLVQARLTAQGRQVATQIDNFYRQGQSISDIITYVNQLPIEEPSQLIFTNRQGLVQAGNQPGWRGQSVSELADLPDRSPREGVLSAADGRPFFYSAFPVGPPAAAGGYIAVVTPRAFNPLRLAAEFAWGFVIAGTAALLVSLVLGIFMAYTIASPLRQIATGAGAVAAGDYEHRLQERGPSEIKHVAQAFNLMIERVEKSQQVMRDFVSNVSHELKTPLTSIQGFSQAILEGATPDEAARQRAAAIIHQEASRMTRLVEDFLDLARIDSGQIVMGKTPLSLAHLLSYSVDQLLPQANRKQLDLIRKVDHLPTVVGDSDRLAQVFLNLLDNAVSHTPSGGSVTITGQIIKGLPRPQSGRAGPVKTDAPTALSERGDFVEVMIADTGPGIPSEDLGRIFERFYRIDKSRRRTKGTGLGLAITAEIVEAHGGYIRAESGPDAGTKIFVILPVSEADARTLVSRRR